MKKLGLALPNFGPNQLSYLAINNVNKFVKDNHTVDIIGFYENLMKYAVSPEFACMQAIEMWGYDGSVVACSLNMAHDITKIPTIDKKYFYVWDLEWIYLGDKEYSKIKSIYSNPELILITRSEEYVQIIERMWNKKVEYVVEDFDINKFASIIWNQN